MWMMTGEDRSIDTLYRQEKAQDLFLQYSIKLAQWTSSCNLNIQLDRNYAIKSISLYKC